MSHAESSIRLAVAQIGQRARNASRQMAVAGTREKNNALIELATRIARQRAALKAANAADVERARAAGFDAAFCRPPDVVRQIH